MKIIHDEINTNTNIDNHIREAQEKGTFDFFNQSMDYTKPYSR